jgi:hypothetical protein
MKKHAAKDGNQQKLKPLGEITSAYRLFAEIGTFPCNTLAIYHRRASLKCPLPMPNCPDAVYRNLRLV